MLHRDRNRFDVFPFFVHPLVFTSKGQSRLTGCNQIPCMHNRHRFLSRLDGCDFAQKKCFAAETVQLIIWQAKHCPETGANCVWIQWVAQFVCQGKWHRPPAADAVRNTAPTFPGFSIPSKTRIIGLSLNFKFESECSNASATATMPSFRLPKLIFAKASSESSNDGTCKASAIADKATRSESVELEKFKNTSVNFTPASIARRVSRMPSINTRFCFFRWTFGPKFC